VLVAALGQSADESFAQPQPKPYRISGRIEGRPPWPALTVGTPEGYTSYGEAPVSVADDGSFVTNPVASGAHVLELSEPNSPEPNARGTQIVQVTSSDVSEIVLRRQQPYALTGRFRMESDNPSAVWPPHIVVNAQLRTSGASFLGSQVAEGAPGGRFVLRNLYGPRVLRCGYTLAAGSRWWPAGVLLEGRDITDVPTDFSKLKAGQQLEVVFTQHPARVIGAVTDARGEPVSQGWIVIFPSERDNWQLWSDRAKAVQADWKGKFDFASMPGRYFVAAVKPEMWLTRERLLADMERLSRDATEVQILPRERKIVPLKVAER
jgi:hypothetical protein